MEVYTVLEKLKENQTTRDDIMNFLDWLAKGGIELATWDKYGRYLDPIPNAKWEELIFGFLGIDPKEVEKERRQILANIEQPST